MKYIISENRMMKVVGKFFSHYINLDNVSVRWGGYWGDNGYEPVTRFITFNLNDKGKDNRDWNEDEAVLFLGGNEADDWLEVSNPPTSMNDVPSKEDIARYTVCVFDEAMADNFNNMFGENSWEEPLMHYINNKLGTSFSKYSIEMI